MKNALMNFVFPTVVFLTLATSASVSGQDLQIPFLNINKRQFYSNDKIDIAFTVRNTGVLAADSSSVRLYFSNDSLPDASDVILEPHYFIYPLTGTSVPNSNSYSGVVNNKSLPVVPPGKYFIIALADVYNTVHETNESNNIAAISLNIITPDIDLVTSATDTVSVAYSGATVTVQSTTANTGTTYSPSSSTGYYFSTDAILSSNDLLLGTNTLGSINPNSSQTASTSITIPAGTAAGAYYLLYVADYNAQITETNEGNNIAYKKINILKPNVDLIVKSVSVNKNTVTASNTIKVTSIIENLGTKPSIPTVTIYYLSSNRTFDGLDYYLGSINTPAIAAGKSVSKTSTLMIEEFFSGTYYMIAVADSGNYQPEISETNNANSRSITIIAATRDLTVKNPSLNKNTVEAGKKLMTGITVKNLGSVASGGFYLGYYLSMDNSFSPDDILLDTQYVNNLNPDASKNISSSFEVPSSTPAGDYYVIYFADNMQVINETNEYNNEIAKGIKVRAAAANAIIAPDLSTSANFTVNVTPNPVADQIHIIFTDIPQGEDIQLSLTDIHNASEIVSKIVQLNNNTVSLPADLLPVGIYQLTINYQGTMKTIKIEKE